MGVSSTKSPKLSQALRREAAVAWLRAAPWKVASMRGVRALPVVDGEEALPHPPRKGMRIFTKGCPIHLMQDVIDILSSETTIVDPVADGSVISGTWYHRIAVWNRDAGTSETGDATKTLIRDLGDGPLSFAAVAEDGCGSTTTIRYYWDAVELISPDTDAHHGLQGFSVRIGGVSRDMETGWFNYFVTVTERKTIHTPEFLSGSDAFGDIYTESWTGLRGTQDAPEDSDGNPVYVPGPEGSPAGSEYNVEWSKNPEDCTWSAQARWTRSKKGVKGSESCAVDLFRHTDTVETQAQGAKLGHAPAAAGGVKKRYISRRRKDKLFDNTVETDAEQYVANARTAVEKTHFADTVTSVAKSASVVPAASVAPSTGTVTQVVSERTPGDLNDVTVTAKVEKTVARARVSKSSDTFSAEESATTRAEYSEEPAVPASGGGSSYGVTSEFTESGRRNNTLSVKTEKSVPAARISRSATLFTDETSTVDRGQANPPAAPVSGGGVTRQTQTDRTPGGLRDNTVTERTEKFVDKARTAADVTVFSRIETEIRKSDTLANVPVSSVSAEAGTVTQVASERTPGDLRDVTLTVRTELPVDRARVAKASDVFGSQESVTARALLVSEPVMPPAGGGVSSEVTAELTDSGRRNLVTSVKTETPVAGAVVTRSATLFEEETVVTDRSQPGAPAVPSSGGGYTRQTRAELTPGGLSNNSSTVRRELFVPEAAKSSEDTVFDATLRVSNKNSATGAPVSTSGGGVIYSAQEDKTPGGSLDVTVTTRTSKPVEAATVSASQDAFRRTRTTVDRNSRTKVADFVAVAAGKVTDQRAETNPDGSFNNTKAEAEAIAFQGAQRAVSQDLFRKEETVTDRNQESADVDPVAPADGVIIEKRAEVNPDNTVNNTRAVKTELECQEATKRVVKTLWGSRTTVTNKSVSEEAVLPEGVTLGAVEFQKTPGGRLDTARTIVSLDGVVGLDGIPIRETRGGDYFRSDYQTVSVVSDKKVDVTGYDAASGKNYDVTYETDEETGIIHKSKKEVAPTVGEVFVIADVQQIFSNPRSLLVGHVYEHTKILAFKNVELSVIREASAAFLTSLVPVWWRVEFGSASYGYEFYYPHDISYGVRVNELGLWDGTLNMHAKLTPGIISTIGS